MSNKAKVFTAFGFVAILILSVALPTFASAQKVSMCHQTNNGWHIISVDDNAVPAHLAQGDFVIDGTHPCPPVEVTAEPTAEVTPAPTEEATAEVTPVVTAEPTTEVTPVVTEEPTEVTPVATEEPTQVTPVPTDDPEQTAEPTTPPVVTTVTPRPHTPVVAPVVTSVQVTVWSNLPGNVGDLTVRWQIRCGKGWCDIHTPDGLIVFTAIEVRDRFNDTLGQVEHGVTMSRIPLSANASKTPHDYRALDANGNLIGVWIQIADAWCNQISNTCGTNTNHANE